MEWTICITVRLMNGKRWHTMNRILRNPSFPITRFTTGEESVGDGNVHSVTAMAQYNAL
jgi:hypothetical protein